MSEDVRQNVTQDTSPDDPAQAAIWAAAKLDYRTNVPTLEIAEKYGINLQELNSRRKIENWTRDKKQEIREQVMDRLGMLNAGPDSGTDDPEQIAVSGAVKVGVRAAQLERSVLDSHVSALDLVNQRLLARLQGRPSPDGIEIELGPKETLSNFVLNFANALARTIPLHRRVNGLDEGEQQKTFDDFIAEREAVRAVKKRATAGAPRRRGGNPPPMPDKPVGQSSARH